MRLILSSRLHSLSNELKGLHNVAVVPRPYQRPVFDPLQYTQMEGEGLVHFIL